MMECFYHVVFILVSLLINVSKSYKILTLEDPSLCSPIVKRRIKLGLETQSALVVSINRLKDHTLDWDTNFFCKFQVDTGKNSKLFAVIQNLTFRKNNATEECIDYMHFKRSDGTISPRYCGNISAVIKMDSRYTTDYLNKYTPTVNSFDDYTGQLDVNIHIAREALGASETMELDVVFTAYRPCIVAMSDDEECETDHHPKNCIYKGFINDGRINCPNLDCVDEGGCSRKIPNEEKKSIGNKVIISTVSVLFITFIVFVTCIWLCRIYKKFCWSEQFATSRNGQSRRPEGTMEMNRHPILDQATATAPTVTQVEEDKDLPPPYESLFPNR